MIVKQLKSAGKEQYRVLFDTGKECLVSEDIVVKYRLVKDKELEYKEYQNLLKEISLATYYNRLLKYALAYIKSTKEYTGYLRKIETPEEYISPIIQDLTEKKVIDDLRYAEMATRHYLDLGYGKQNISYRLKESGVVSDIISEVVSKIEDEFYHSCLLKLIRKKIKSLKGELDFKAKQKIITYAFSHGFEYPLIQEILNTELDRLK